MEEICLANSAGERFVFDWFCPEEQETRIKRARLKSQKDLNDTLF